MILWRVDKLSSHFQNVKGHEDVEDKTRNLAEKNVPASFILPRNKK